MPPTLFLWSRPLQRPLSAGDLAPPAALRVSSFVVPTAIPKGSE